MLHNARPSSFLSRYLSRPHSSQKDKVRHLSCHSIADTVSEACRMLLQNLIQSLNRQLSSGNWPHRILRLSPSFTEQIIELHSMQKALSVSFIPRKTNSGIHVLPQVHGGVLTAYVPLWSTVLQDSRHLGQCADCCEAASPLPVPLTPRAPRGWNALVEICNFDYLIISQIAAVLELWPEEGRLR